MDAKEQLKSEIQWRIQFVINDCNTLIQVREKQAPWFRESGLGGGNFMMAQSLFAALNFLAKLNARLWHRERMFRTSKHVEDVKHAVHTLKNQQNQTKLRGLFSDCDFRGLLTGDFTEWKASNTRDCVNEQRAFVKLVDEMRPQVDLGISGRERV